jgi:carbonic anhydrase
MPFTRPASIQAAIDRLQDGNRRFVEERPTATVQSALRIELAAGQTPFAVVLGCSDSRVPIETIFDQQPGNLFVVRVAGNIVNDDGLASIEYSVDLLNSLLVVVLGHSRCGAVTGAVHHIADGWTFHGHIQRLVDAIAPAAETTRGADGDWLENAVEENVRNSVRDLLRRSPLLSEAVEKGNVGLVGAVYDLHSGMVTFQPPLP